MLFALLLRLMMFVTCIMNLVLNSETTPNTKGDGAGLFTHMYTQNIQTAMSCVKPSVSCISRQDSDFRTSDTVTGIKFYVSRSRDPAQCWEGHSGPGTVAQQHEIKTFARCDAFCAVTLNLRQ